MILLFWWASAAVAHAEVIRFSRGEVYYELTLGAREIQLTDRLGPRTVVRQPCNARLIAGYEADLRRRVRDLNELLKGRTIATVSRDRGRAAIIAVDDRLFGLRPLNPHLKYFTHLPATTDVLFVESLKSCRR